MSAPTFLLFAATTEGTVRVINARISNYVYELKALEEDVFIGNLCREYEKETKLTYPNILPSLQLSDYNNEETVVGNLIDVQNQSTNAQATDALSLISNKMENTTRHLRGNWLAYWDHDIVRSEKNIMFNFKQISIVFSLDNENSFTSGSSIEIGIHSSRDKSVKLWSLRSVRWHSSHLGSITLNPGGLIQWMAVSRSGMWLGTGKSSGHIAVSDTKTGVTISTWRVHENDVLELVAHG
ncbi:hypothetical protein FQR65_LT10392 [Abscondita terminalis]|nr:hypothetical protein FQR65_LT10392 [Abscondita terminalis]